MRVNLYAIFDSAGRIYDGPIPGQSDGFMNRKFSDLCLNADHDIGKHPHDYTLFHVGSWDDSKGELENVENRKLLNGSEVIAAAQSGENINA